MPLSLAVLAAASSQLALASPASSVLQFEGAVRGTTCTVSVGGVEAPNPATVILEPARLDDLKTNLWVRNTRFDIDLKNCAGAATKANVMMQAANGITVTFNYVLDNMATIDPAENVSLVIFMKDPNTGGWGSVGMGSPPWREWWTDIGEERLQFLANYQVFSGIPTPGNVEAAVQFTVAYQ